MFLCRTALKFPTPSCARARATVIDGKQVAKDMLEPLKAKVQRLKDLHVRPCLAPVLVGNDPSSEAYIKRKVKAAHSVGVDIRMERLPEEATTDVVLSTLQKLNNDATVHGIILQLPLPPHLSELMLCNSVDPTKDVDGFTTRNLGSLVQSLQARLSTTSFIPCTALAVMRLLLWHTGNRPETLASKRAAVLGRSLNVGLPIAMLLLADAKKGGFDLTTTVCHRCTVDLEKHTQNADVIVSAVGIPGLVKPDMVKPGAVVIDVGLTRKEDAEGKVKLVGDVDPDVMEVAGAMTPVPGGVGPCTVAGLLHNTVLAAERSMLSFSL